MIRTIIVDDEVLSRIGLRSFLDGKDGITVSGIFGEAADAIKFLEENVVDVVLTDIEMTDINGLEFIQYIREKNLAPGVIIVSCHEDFSYAQQAISLGTDSYILKHSVTEEKLISEVKKVYEKTLTAASEKKQTKSSERDTEEIRQECVYRVGILMVDSNEDCSVSQNQPERDMLVHLLEEIVSRYQMGTLFAQYNKEIFVLFQMEKEKSPEERRELLENWVTLLEKNAGQYVSGTLICGLSEEYENLADTRQQYDDAVKAAENQFFYPQEKVFYHKEAGVPGAFPFFSVDYFLEEQWLTIFERELEEWLERAWKQSLAVDVAKQMLIQNIRQLITHILEKYGFSERFQEKWSRDILFISEITTAKNITELKQVLKKQAEEFQKEAQRESIQNPMQEMFDYIEQHLGEKLALSELADMSCMSIPSFCKKFKERTGKTVTQYLNDKRIESAKVLLREQKYSLEEIAEMTGFSNSNYLLRVFKKTTGCTIGEYRRKYGITE